MAGIILTYVPNWEDSRIRPNMMRIYSRTRPAEEALNEFRNNIKRKLCNDVMDYQLSLSTGLHRSCTNCSGEFHITTEQSIKALNKELKDQWKLVLPSGRVYECTINDPTEIYSL